MNQEQTNTLINLLKKKGVKFHDWLTFSEFFEIEKKFWVKFPPDLRLFLETSLPVSDKFINWRLWLASSKEEAKIQERIRWPYEGMCFDIKNNNFWHEPWWEPPKSLDEKFNIAYKNYLKYPKLIPIFGHRYLPSKPLEIWNPVFSVYQMDIAYYGYDLANYFANEFHFELPEIFNKLEKPIRSIEFWSQWADL